MQDIDLLTDSYDYTLPPELIASKPLHPRDSAKLLVYDRANEKIIHTTFASLLEFLPQDCHVFLNDTRVIKARLFGQKETGGKVELLLNKPLSNNLYNAMIRGRVKEGTKITFQDQLTAVVQELNSDGSRSVAFLRDSKPLLFEELVLVLDKIGHIPLPPYIQRPDDNQDLSDYQSLFAKHAGAVAAPTASLHFTPELFEQLEKTYPTHKLTLHVGAGTFKPVDTTQILDHPMHSEYFHIPQKSAQVLQSATPILAIGTTVTRTVEYHARTTKTSGECNLFLNPSNQPIRVNHLLTNFHLPKSTLIMLVSAFIGREKTLSLYEEAIAKKYRFFSYGDAMLIV